MLDYQECKARVEKMAAESRGTERLDAMRRWVEVRTCSSVSAHALSDCCLQD